MATMRCIWCEHDLAIIRRLAEYEDSGLSPEELTELLRKLTEAGWAMRKAVCHLRS